MTNSWFWNNRVDDDAFSSSSASYIIDDNRPLHMLNPNQFYKICSSSATATTNSNNNDGNSNSNGNGRSNVIRDDQPLCGDGSSFCFYFTKPSQRRSNNERLLIEVMGGGTYLYRHVINDDVYYTVCVGVSFSFSSFFSSSSQKVPVGIRIHVKNRRIICT